MHSISAVNIVTWSVHAVQIYACELLLPCPPPPAAHAPLLLPPSVPLRGAQDRLIPGATQALGHSGTPGSWLVMVPDAGHVVPYQHPSLWAKQVLRFLDSARPVSLLGGLMFAACCCCCCWVRAHATRRCCHVAYCMPLACHGGVQMHQGL